jgi:hexosaminidase
MSTAMSPVKERIFMLDCARKYFTPTQIKSLIDRISVIGYNALNLHLSDICGFRIESKIYPWLAGGDHTLCHFGREYGMKENDDKYITQAQMADIVRYAAERGMKVIPSIDSPGHMTYAIKRYFLEYGVDIAAHFCKNGTSVTVPYVNAKKDLDIMRYSRCIDIINPAACEFMFNLHCELGQFFYELGCRDFDIGGDELFGWQEDGVIDKSLPKWQNLDHWQEYAQKVTGNDQAVAYDAFILYMNKLCAILRSIGYESVRMWNDDAYRKIDTGWQGATNLDSSIEIQYWCPLTNNGENTARFYLDCGHAIYNFINPYAYYTLYPDGAPSLITPDAILKEWHPYLFAPNDSICTTDNTFVFPPFNPGNLITEPTDMIKGAGFCLWCDTPSRFEADELFDLASPYYTALIKKMLG